ncbi:MAG: HAMP domain-containing protein [Rhizobiaceae bacterium]|nr:HAMP domain-containing protein [Rhizobiaceae bacterium]
MLSIRSSISTKFFAAMMAVAALIVVFVAIIIAVNMRSGFSRYLAEAELARFERLHDALAEAYDAAAPGWPQLADNDRAWRRFIREAVPPPRPPPRRRPQGGERPRRPPPPTDPMSFGSRLTLLDASGDWVVGGGSNRSSALFAQRPIYLSDSDTTPIGWFGFSSDQRQVGGANALFLRDQLLALLATSVVALLLSALAAYWLARLILKPVRKLADAGDRLSQGDYSIRLDEDRSDELGALLKQFNSLAESLDTRDKVERKWISDTSHELKTPLAVLRAQIEAIQDGVHKPDAKRLEELHSSTMRLTQLVADLNALSNMREGHLATHKQTEDLTEIIKGRLDNTLDHLSGKDLSVASHLQPDLLVECDRFRIGQLLDNLLQNAARYTDAPGKILISTRSLDGKNGLSDRVEICVEDSPPCPPASAREKLFDRFYRVELSRDRRYGGSGLGLSICREIVSAHHGTISLAPSELGGLKVSVILPNKQPQT